MMDKQPHTLLHSHRMGSVCGRGQPERRCVWRSTAESLLGGAYDGPVLIFPSSRGSLFGPLPAKAGGARSGGRGSCVVAGIGAGPFPGRVSGPLGGAVRVDGHAPRQAHAVRLGERVMAQLASLLL